MASNDLKCVYVSFIPLLSHKYLSKFSVSPKPYPIHKVFILNNKDEELYWPSKVCNLNSNEIKVLKQFYSELFNIPKRSISVI